MKRSRSAGLPLSVGGAPLPLRLLLAIVFFCTGVISIAAAVLLALRGPLPAIVIAAAAVTPLGIIACVAAAFVLAPYSRFGRWLDAFVATLNVRGALLLFLAIDVIAAVVLFGVRIARTR